MHYGVMFRVACLGAWLMEPLKVSTPPLANTARYDSLRADNATEEAGHDA